MDEVTLISSLLLLLLPLTIEEEEEEEEEEGTCLVGDGELLLLICGAGELALSEPLDLPLDAEEEEIVAAAEEEEEPAEGLTDGVEPGHKIPIISTSLEKIFLSLQTLTILIIFSLTLSLTCS
ncbi:hypothetical protein WICPIJ_002992 [Wickerhamomyces pijperi]|uniref:Uncharacterized protein n=1 Tax=Wickerhamomyces pijperi TaxID=599730 RepID=A0A9P8Q8G3_WICPI|nr:hypothetical protein WICPIJ_002992 [Wickerhamomyces pijperi]